MKWIKASEKMPSTEEKINSTLNIKYKGKADALILLEDPKSELPNWYWAGDDKGKYYLVQDESWNAIEWLDEEDDGWINVQGRLPENSDGGNQFINILVYKHIYGVCEAYFNPVIKKFLSLECNIIEGIKFWQPLPNPPKVK